MSGRYEAVHEDEANKNHYDNTHSYNYLVFRGHMPHPSSKCGWVGDSNPAESLVLKGPAPP